MAYRLINGRSVWVPTPGINYNVDTQQGLTPVSNSGASRIMNNNGTTYSVVPENSSWPLLVGGSPGPSGPNTGSNPPPTPPTPPNPSQNDLLQNRLNGIMQRLQLMRGEGERLRNAAKGVRDEVWGNIDTQYGGLANAAKQKRQSSLDALAETDRGVVRDYATGQGTLNKAAEGSELKNRALARALGFGNGSYYQNMQRENTSNLFDKTAGLTNERSGKLADIKTKVGETNTWFDQKSLEIDQEAKSLKAQADREYQDNVSKSTLAEQMYGIDAADAAAQAEYDYRNKLNSIDSYVNNKQGILDAIASVSGARKSEVNAYQPIDAKLQARLSNSGDLTEASNPNFDTISNPVETGTLSGLNKMFKGLAQNPLQDYLYAGLSDARRFLPTGAFNS